MEGYSLIMFRKDTSKVEVFKVKFYREAFEIVEREFELYPDLYKKQYVVVDNKELT